MGAKQTYLTTIRATTALLSAPRASIARKLPRQDSHVNAVAVRQIVLMRLNQHLVLPIATTEYLKVRPTLVIVVHLSAIVPAPRGIVMSDRGFYSNKSNT